MKSFIYNLGIRLTGVLIFLLCLLGLVTTTLLSISGSIKDFNNLTLPELALIFTISFSALTIFTASCFLTKIKTHYYCHYRKIVILRVGLLVVMIYNNFHFFLKVMIDSSFSDKIIYFILCFLVDFSTMTLLPFAFDRMLLIFTFKEKSMLTDNILKMLIFNLTFKYTHKIKLDYEKNLKLVNSVQDKETIEVKEVKPDIKLLEEKPAISDLDKRTRKSLDKMQDSKKNNVSDFVQDKSTSKVKNDIACNDTNNIGKVTKLDFDKNVDEKLFLKIIYENKKDNVCPSIDFLMQATGFNKDKIRELKKKFSSLGILKTSKFTTFLLIDDYATALKMLNGGGVHYEEKH